MSALPKLTSLERVAVHTITTKPWPIETSIEQYARHGFGGITVWRDALEGRDLAKVGSQIKDAGLAPVALVRGGFFCHDTEEEKTKALEDNRKAIREAEGIGAPMVVLVCGAKVGLPLSAAREQIRDGIAAVLPEAEAAGVQLAIEPLHPMYADIRSAVNTLESANDLAEALNSPYAGVAVDVYHLWWDPHLEREVRRCGEGGNLLAFHVCDWRTPTEDMLLDRGLMGEGCIDIPLIRSWVEKAGFSGFNEVEIFSTRNWERDQEAWLAEIATASMAAV